MDQRVADLEHALRSVLNYFEPPCYAEDCDKGYHVKQLRVYRHACRLVGFDPDKGYNVDDDDICTPTCA